MNLSTFVPRYTLGATAQANDYVNETPFALASLDATLRGNLMALVFERASQLGAQHGHVGVALQVNYGYLVQLRGGLRRLETASTALLLAMASYLQLPLVQVVQLARPSTTTREAEQMAELVKTVQRHEAIVVPRMAELGFHLEQHGLEWFSFIRESVHVRLKVGCYLDASEYGPMAQVIPALCSDEGRLCVAEEYFAHGDWTRWFVQAFERVTAKALQALTQPAHA